MVSGVTGDALEKLEASSEVLLAELQQAACGSLASCKIHGPVCCSSSNLFIPSVHQAHHENTALNCHMYSTIHVYSKGCLLQVGCRLAAGVNPGLLQDAQPRMPAVKVTREGGTDAIGYRSQLNVAADKQPRAA